MERSPFYSKHTIQRYILILLLLISPEISACENPNISPDLSPELKARLCDNFFMEPTYNSLSRPHTSAKMLQECSRVARKAHLEEKKDQRIRQACMALDTHLQHLEEKLDQYCVQAGEKIHHKVNNVEGVLIDYDIKNPRNAFGYFHADDRHSHKYILALMGRHYEFHEMKSPHDTTQIIQTRRIPVPGKKRAQTQSKSISLSYPEASYGVRWKELTPKQEQYQGLYGDEIQVFDITTGEVLATRTFYYIAINRSLKNKEGRLIRVPISGASDPYYVATCSNYAPKENTGRKDLMPRDSYEFVSRVLIPKKPSAGDAINIFDLAIGSGKRSSYQGCLSLTFGPDITREDLAFERTSGDGDISLLIRLRNRPDYYYCGMFFSPAGKGFQRGVNFRFYDGETMEYQDILDVLETRNRNDAIVRP